MKDELIKLQIEKLIKEREDIAYEIRQVGLNDMQWVNANMNATQRMNDITFRIDNLLMQLTN